MFQSRISDRERFFLIPFIVALSIIFSGAFVSVGEILIPGTWFHVMGKLLLSFSIVFGCIYIGITWGVLTWNSWVQSKGLNKVGMISKDQELYSFGDTIVKMTDDKLPNILKMKEKIPRNR